MVALNDVQSMLDGFEWLDFTDGDQIEIHTTTSSTTRIPSMISYAEYMASSAIEYANIRTKRRTYILLSKEGADYRRTMFSFTLNKIWNINALAYHYRWKKSVWRNMVSNEHLKIIEKIHQISLYWVLDNDV